MCFVVLAELFHLKRGRKKDLLITCPKFVVSINNQANIDFFKVDNKNIRKRCEIHSTFTIKTPEQLQKIPRPNVFRG